MLGTDHRFYQTSLIKRRYTVTPKYLHAKVSYSSLIVCPKLETKDNSKDTLFHTYDCPMLESYI